MSRDAVVVLGVLLLLVVGLCCGRQQAGPTAPPSVPARPPGPQAGGPSVPSGEASAKVMELTDADFASKILAADKPAMVDFWAEWCGPCREQAPIVEAVAAKYAGKIIVGKLNVDEQPETAKKYKIDAIPTLVFFKGGKEVGRVVGLTREGELSGKIEKALLGK